MAALSANRTLTIGNNVAKASYSGTVTAAKTVFKHALLVYEATGATVEPATDLTTTHFAGLSIEPAVAGATVNFVTDLDVCLPCESDVVAADLGKILYCHDDGSVCEANTYGPPCGRHVGMGPTGYVYVRLGEMTALGVAS